MEILIKYIVYICMVLFFIGICWFLMRSNPEEEYSPEEEYNAHDLSEISQKLSNENINIASIQPESISGGGAQPIQYNISHDKILLNIKIQIDKSNFESQLDLFKRKLHFFEEFITMFFVQNARQIQVVGYQEAYLKTFRHHLKQFKIEVNMDNESEYSAQRQLFYYYLGIFLEKNPSFEVIDE